MIKVQKPKYYSQKCNTEKQKEYKSHPLLLLLALALVVVVVVVQGFLQCIIGDFPGVYLFYFAMSK